MRISSIILAVTIAITVSGCNYLFPKEKPKPPPAPHFKVPVIGIDFTTATKETLTKALSNANIGYLRTINNWEEQWEAGETFPGAEFIRIGFTEQHLLAYFQYDFKDKTAEKTVDIVNIVKGKFGEPSSEDGEISSGGEYIANWDMGDGTRIQVKRDYPKLMNHLTYFNDPLFDVLKLEFSISAKRKINEEIEMRDRLFK